MTSAKKEASKLTEQLGSNPFARGLLANYIRMAGPIGQELNMEGHPEWKLQSECIYHGEYDTNWLVLFDRATGKEIRRYNANALAVIQWEPNQ